MFSRLVMFLIVCSLFLASFAFTLSNLNQSAWPDNLIKQNDQNIAPTTPIAPEASPSSDASLSSALSISKPPSATPSPSTKLVTRAPSAIYSYDSDSALKNIPWGQSVQISETGYRMKVGLDQTMATAEETFKALNFYRYTKGKSNLTWDDRLAKYALERATYICQKGSDGHAGFTEYVDKQQGYKNLGFYSLGENMSTHMRLTGTHLIEWMYAGDAAHDGNQLGNWSHVGVGIFGDCSALIFANQMI